ncbi:MAG: tyrosine--tRNA ligase [Deltaproteobacteria bacterium]|nr:tyrosine--tRNA ligase [Deltaproteobacteria bacterium]MBW2076574.1 tyrosine--tRNA ligase [Deltaproteobacteria bacterium]RLB30156.1 MAG: tyrosine--tRNA ligase [Deltaproteobacteria bacterium]
MENVYDIFKERGFIEQVTDEGMLREVLASPISCYIGFDPTAKSLHVGSLLPIMSLAHMQRQGHRPIAVVGAGTALVGDPSGKDEARRVMSREEIDANAEGIKRQLARFIEFSDGKALMVNNADWLTPLNYIEFLRDIGRHFSVNRMLAAESYRQRLESGLSFLEFNYMLLQAYDFWHLYKHYDCILQMGGNDQWGNILAGVDLTRRLEGGVIHGLTFPLITVADGQKMGKTHRGTIWLDPELTCPYEYYQYWINTDDRDIKRFLCYFTFLPMEEIEELSGLGGNDPRVAKEVLAYETTKLCHGQKEAERARSAAGQLFGEKAGDDLEGVPTYSMTLEELGDGIEAYILFQDTALCTTRSQARRLISQGGAYVNGERIRSFETKIGPDYIRNNAILLRAGKKRYLRVHITNP